MDTNWFRDRLADRGLSQRALARHMGLDAAAVSLMLRGRRVMKLTEAAEIARLQARSSHHPQGDSGHHSAHQGQDYPLVGLHGSRLVGRALDGVGGFHRRLRRARSTGPRLRRVEKGPPHA